MIVFRLARMRCICILLSSLFAANAHAGDMATEMRKAMGVSQYKDVTYLDENKKPIDAAEFDRRLNEGASASMKKQMNGDVVTKVVMSIEPKDAPPAPKVKYKIKPGAPFPAFSLAQRGGGTIDNKALLGRYSVLSFYFADCAPCVQEVPELNKLASDRTDLNLIGVTFDSAKVSDKFVADHDFKWRLLPDAASVLKAIGVKAYPTFALLDPKGALVAIAGSSDIIKSDKSITAWVKRLTANRK